MGRVEVERKLYLMNLSISALNSKMGLLLGTQLSQPMMLCRNWPFFSILKFDLFQPAIRLSNLSAFVALNLANA